MNAYTLFRRALGRNQMFSNTSWDRSCAGPTARVCGFLRMGIQESIKMHSHSFNNKLPIQQDIY